MEIKVPTYSRLFHQTVADSYSLCMETESTVPFVMHEATRAMGDNGVLVTFCDRIAISEFVQWIGAPQADLFTLIGALIINAGA